MSIFNFLQGIERDTKKKVEDIGGGIFNFLKNAKAPEAVTSNPVYKGLQNFSENVAAPVLTGATRAAAEVPSNIATTIGKVATLGTQNQELDQRNQETQRGIQDFLSSIGIQEKNNSLAQKAGRGAIGLTELVGQLPIGGGLGEYTANLAKAGVGIKSLDALKSVGEINPTLARNLVTTMVNPTTDNLAVKGARIAGEGLGFGAAQNAIEGKGPADIAKSTTVNTVGGTLLHDVGVLSKPAALKIKNGLETFIKNGQAEGVAEDVLQRAKDAYNNSPLADEHGFIKLDIGKPNESSPIGEQPNVSDMNRALNVRGANTTRQTILGGGAETQRLTDPKTLQLAKDYPANKLPSDVTPDSAVTVYRAAKADKPIGEGDFVSLSRPGAQKYVQRTPGLQITAEQVPLRDLVYGNGTRNEYVYSPQATQAAQGPQGPQGALDALSAPTQQSVPETSQTASTSATEKLIAALKKAKPAQENIAKAQSQALGARSAAGEKILSENQGENAFQKAKTALQGPLVQNPPTIKSKLTQPDLNGLFGQIQNHPQLRFFEKIRAYDALNKVFEGTVPQKNEIGLLEDVFGTKFAKEIVDINKSTGQKIREGIMNVANIPRAIMSSFDFSAPFRQGLVLTASHPVSAVKAGGQMFKTAFSPKVYNGWLEDLKNSDQFNRIKDSGLYIADARHAAGSLNDKEEAFMSNLAEKIPIIGRVIKGSERAYNTYLNKIRVDTFNSLADRYTASGQGSEQNLQSLAKFINTATGRGNLGKLEKIAPELNTVLFAPRNMASRLNMLNPGWYVGLKGPAKKEAIKSAGIVLATGLTTLAVAKAAGAEVNDDPRSTDFGKIKIGDTRYDIWGGFQQYARVAAQLLSGEKNVQGETTSADRLDTTTKFIRSKLAPIPASVVDIAEGTDYVGQPVTVGSLAKKNLLPFGVQDVSGTDAGTAASALPSVFGVGFQNYSPNDTGGRNSGSGGRGANTTGGRGGSSGGRGK